LKPVLETETAARPPAVIAHRGASRAERENTIAAFEAAVAMGADGIELDVRRTADGLLAVHHDAITSRGALIVATDFGELQHDIVDLASALEVCGDLLVNVEIKNRVGDADHDPVAALVSPVIEALDRFGRPDQLLVSSFDLGTIDRVRSESGYRTAYLVDRGDPTAVLRTCIDHGHEVVHPWDRLVDEVFVAQAKSLGLEVNVWTVDDPSRMRQLAALGVDGIVTNVPDIAIKTLRD
jgi:glycerophosphoryl diester phosphodiesterase